MSKISCIGILYKVNGLRRLVTLSLCMLLNIVLKQDVCHHLHLIFWHSTLRIQCLSRKFVCNYISNLTNFFRLELAVYERAFEIILFEKLEFLYIYNTIGLSAYRNPNFIPNFEYSVFLFFSTTITTFCFPTGDWPAHIYFCKVT